MRHHHNRHARQFQLSLALEPRGRYLVPVSGRGKRAHLTDAAGTDTLCRQLSAGGLLLRNYRRASSTRLPVCQICDAWAGPAR